MNMKTMFSAVAALFITGNIAEAATFSVENFHMRLRFEGTSFSNLHVMPHDDPTGEESFVVDIAPGEYEYGISQYTHLSIGDIVEFIATVSFPVPIEYPGGGGNSGTAPVCVLGGRDCSIATYTNRYADWFEVARWDDEILTVPLAVGDTIVHGFAGFPRLNGETFNDYARFTFESQTSSFTILEILDVPAPIPLPAGILLLPVAIAGFGVLRRRKAVSLQK